MKEILKEYKDGKIELCDVLEKIKQLPYENIGFAKIDNHRLLRKGFPESIFCQGKTIPQIIKIIQTMKKRTSTILATKANKNIFAEVKKQFPEATYHEQAKIIVIQKNALEKKKGLILILTAGTSDIPVAEEAAVTAEVMGNHVKKIYDVGVAGVHRLLNFKKDIDNASVVIVIAGMEGALASIVGGLTSKPVIAVPTSIGYGASFHGIAPLLTMMNSCAEGVVVVNIDNGFGAAYFASLINR